MNVRTIREALAEALEGQGYRVYDTIPANAQLPTAAVLWPDEIAYNTTIGGGVALDITVTVAVPVTDFIAAQKQLDEAMSTPGLVEPLQQHSTEAWYSLIVNSSSNVRQMAEPQSLAVDFNITINA